MIRNVKASMAILLAIVFAACSKESQQSHQLSDQTEIEMETETQRTSTMHRGKKALVFNSAGMIDSAVKKFRDILGPLNFMESQTGGRKEINWEDVVLFLTNNNNFPGAYYNRTDAGGPYSNKRGVVFSTPGSGFRVSNNNFSDIDSLYRDEFVPFSPSKNFAALKSNIIDINFKEGGTDKPGYVHGFGAVFNDVNISGSTSVSLYSGYTFLGTYKVKIGDTGEPSFFGIYLPAKKITRARIKLGTAALQTGRKDVCDSGSEDLVTLDDLIFSTPRRFYHN